jgi:hypothetical protein
MLDTGEGGAEHVLHRIPGRVHGDLGDEAHPAALSDDHLALVVVHLPCQDVKKRGLSRAVPAQQADPFPLVNLEGEAVQHVFPHFKGFDQIVYLNVNHILSVIVQPIG